MARVYSVVFANVSVSAAQDLFELVPAANKPLEILGLEIAQNGNSDVGDAQEEMLRIQIVRGNTTSGSAGTTPTPSPVKQTDAAASFTAEANNTTAASGGTPVVVHESAFNVRAGYLNWFREGCEPDCSAAVANNRICVRLPAAPADAITLTATVWVREQG